MNTKTIIIIGGVVLVIVIAGVAFLFLSSGSTPAPVNQNPSNPFGAPAGSIPSQGTTTSSSPDLPVVLNDGSTVNVPNFTQSNQPSWASSKAGYQVAGSVDSDFLITYILPDSRTGKPEFLITLLKEPLGQVRLEAEQALRSRLGLDNAQLCKLDVTLSPGPGVNDSYMGENLGLSFCPGAISLPS